MVTPAPTASGSRKTTAKGVGVKARKVTLTAKTVSERFAIVRATAGRGRKAKVPTGAFLDAILRAYSMPALPASIQGVSPAHAEQRRDWCAKNGAPTVTTDQVVHPNRAKDKTKKKGIVHDRPENTVLADLRAFATVMGLPVDTFRAVRSKAYKEGQTCPVYIVKNR